MTMISIAVALWIIAGALAYIAVMAARGRLTGPKGLQGEKGETGEPGKDGAVGHYVPTKQKKASGLVRVMEHRAGKWQPGQWVSDGSPDCQKALDTPGQAILRGDHLDLGRQS